MPLMPSGTVTFLFTDIEDSTRLWDEHPELMRVALARHDAILRAVIDGHGGLVFSTGGDGVAAAFQRAGDAAAAAVGAQRALLIPRTCRVGSPTRQVCISAPARTLAPSSGKSG